MQKQDSARPKTHTTGPVVDESGAAMGGILAHGAAWGIPVLFAVTMLITRLDGVSWGGSAAISVWSGLIGGPFFGSMVFFGKRVGELGH